MRYQVGTLLLITTAVGLLIGIPIAIFGEIDREMIAVALERIAEAWWYQVPFALVLIFGAVWIWCWRGESRKAALLVCIAIYLRLLQMWLGWIYSGWIYRWYGDLSPDEKDAVLDRYVVVTATIAFSQWLLVVGAFLTLLQPTKQKHGESTTDKIGVAT